MNSNELGTKSGSEYQTKAARTICDQVAALERLVGGHIYGSDQNKNRMQVLHSLIGAMGELGELCTVVQKWLWYGKEFNPEELKAKLADEYGDALWYIAEGLTALGVDMVKVMEANITKLVVRYPEKYSDHLAQEENRNRVNEHQAIVNVLGKNIPVTVSPIPTPVSMTTVKPDQPSMLDKQERRNRVDRIEQDGHGFGHVVMDDDDGQPE